MLPQFISLGLFNLNTYSFLLVCAVGVCVGWARWQTGEWHGLSVQMVLGMAAVCAGRLGYVALHWDYFLANPAEMFSLPLAGIQEHAAIFGACLAHVLLHKPISNASIPHSPFSILHSPFSILNFCLLGIAASLGCVPNGCAFGKELFWQNAGWLWHLRADLPDVYLTQNPRMPTQFLLAVWLGLVLLSCAVYEIKKPKTTTRNRVLLNACCIFAFALGDFVIQFARGDASLFWRGLRVEQGLDVLLALGCLGAVIAHQRRT